MKVYFDSVGCRLNQAEIEKIALEFRAQGHEIVDSPGNADLAVVNTCAVTAAAASDSRQKIRQAARAGVKEIVVTGCWATLEPGEAASMQGVSRVFVNSQKDQLGSSLLGTDHELFDLEPLERHPLPGIHKRTRAFIKVQDGCNNFCTFCVTRIARGRSVSLSKEAILQEVLSAEKGGVKEIVLTGVNMGFWGKDLNGSESIMELIHFLLEETSIPRIRLSSIEPWDLNDEFLDLWRDTRLCPHFHLPLQSGDGETLKRMARPTTPAQYRNIVAQIRKRIPEVAITTDIIVGFPGETEEQFENSLSFVKEMNFAGGHVFKFSSREGTPASKMSGRVNGKIARLRSQRMRDVLKESELKYWQSFLGREVKVLWESVSKLGPEGWRLNGLTENYLPVTATGPQDLWNTLSIVKLCEISGDSLSGEISFEA